MVSVMQRAWQHVQPAFQHATQPYDTFSARCLIQKVVLPAGGARQAYDQLVGILAPQSATKRWRRHGAEGISMLLTAPGLYH
jgi:hypothetical protein